jgi:hypothetical protein
MKLWLGIFLCALLARRRGLGLTRDTIVVPAKRTKTRSVRGAGIAISVM